MRSFKTFFLALALFAAMGPRLARGQGFTEPDVLFYGEVRKSGGGQTVLLQSGRLKMTFVNQSNSTNRVTLEGDLYPVGTGDTKPYSYAVKVPIAYLPESPRMGAFLSVTTNPTSFKLEEITIDGTPATLPDGSKEFYGLSFASRSGEYRLDLLVAGDSISTAQDGIPDWWKRIFGLDTTLDVAGLDPDGDGWSNLEEFRRGSDPLKSNLEPVLVTSAVRVPELGEAGVFLQFLDSNTAESAIAVTLATPEDGGFQLMVDGSEVSASVDLHVSDLKAGRLTLRHTDRSIRRTVLPVSWNDGGESFAGQISVAVVAPTLEDGSDASLWLNGSDLPAPGTPISSWTDRSGNARSAMQPTLAYQPVAGNRSVEFSKTTSAHLFFPDSAIANGDHTVLAAYRAAASADEDQTLLSSNRGYLQFAATTQAVSYPGAPNYQMDGVAVRGYESAAGSITASIFRRKGSLVQNIFGVSYSGENVEISGIEPVLPTIGARRSAIPGAEHPIDHSFAGALHELIVFQTALGEQKLRDVHDYLQSKWAGAVVWNESTELKPVILTAGPGWQRRIIRGGFAQDQLSGGPGDDTISGGAGDDILTGGAGSDRFLFGGLDIGRKTITDFDLTRDTVDLSALYWGVIGDARQYISVRLDTDYSTQVPTLDTALIVKLQNGTNQEIVLKNVVIGSTQLIQLIVEGRICMGALSIPTAVQISLASGSGTTPVAESLGQSFSVKLTRSGAGTSGALDVPVGFFNEGSGGFFVVDGATSTGGQRAVVNFPRGVTSKTVTVHAVPDLDTTGPSSLQIAVLPRYQYSVTGSAVTQAVTDNPKVWLEVIAASAIASPAQPARLVLHRDGDLTGSLDIDLKLGGTAENGVHIQQVPDRLTIPPGQGEQALDITARPEGLTDGAKVLMVEIAPRDRYVTGSPEAALLFVGSTEQEVTGVGFDRWISNVSGGTIPKLQALLSSAPGRLQDYLLAYGLGASTIEDLWKKGIVLRVVDGQPELTIPAQLNAPDLRWSIQASNNMTQWSEATASFTPAPSASGMRFMGPPFSSAAHSKFYRVNMTLDPAPSAQLGINNLIGAGTYGFSGNAGWTTELATGSVLSSGGSAGNVSRIISKVNAPTAVNFQMAIRGGGAGDGLVFYVDGVRTAATSGAPVVVQRTWTDSSAHLLMWEFTKGAGVAEIKNLAQ